jgi:hypothetical protein
LSLTLIILFKGVFKYKIKVETKAHLCFLNKVGGRCGCVYGTEGAADRKSLGITGLDDFDDVQSRTGTTLNCLLPML